MQYTIYDGLKPKTNVKKFILGAAFGTFLFGFLAVPTFAAKSGFGYGEQPGYSQASDCGNAHGSFSYFDGNTNLGINSLGPGTPTYHGGKVGQEPGATGYNNSHTNCQQ